MNVRPARIGDLESLRDLLSPSRAFQPSSLRAAVESGSCFLAEINGQIIGCGVLSYDFFDRGFIKFLHARPEYRRRAVASALLSALEVECNTTVIFTSTNSSNVPMQKLLAKLGYQASGSVEGLDPGDPELFFRKLLGPKESRSRASGTMHPVLLRPESHKRSCP